MSRASDPFRAGPDLSAYVPRPDVDQSCRYLAAKLEAGPTWVGICGPPGVGKTMLLRLLMRRLGTAFTALYVPSAQLTPDELERWIAAHATPEPADGASAHAQRLASAGRPLVLAIDEAQLASPLLIARIEALCSEEVGARAVLAWIEYEGERAPEALLRCPTRVFVEPLELAEVPAYVEAQLARVAAAPEERALLAGQTLDRIALASGGNPRAIQRLADAELAAHAWRTRSTPLRVPLALGDRTTASAPRRSAGATPVEAPRSHEPLRMFLWVLATVIAFVTAALSFSR